MLYILIKQSKRAMFSANHSCVALIACFPALGTGFMFSRPWHLLHVFLRLALVACFPALGTGFMFFRPWHLLRVFPRLEPVTCFLFRTLIGSLCSNLCLL